MIDFRLGLRENVVELHFKKIKKFKLKLVKEFVMHYRNRHMTSKKHEKYDTLSKLYLATKSSKEDKSNDPSSKSQRKS